MMGLAAFGGTLGFVSAGNNQQGTSTVPAYQGKFGDVGSSAGVGVTGAGQDQGDGFVQIVKNVVNIIMGFLALITLVLLLWGGFQMVTAAGDDNKFQAGQKILKQAGIGLGFIAVSWFLVSMIFWIISKAVGA